MTTALPLTLDSTRDPGRAQRITDHWAELRAKAIDDTLARYGVLLSDIGHGERRILPDRTEEYRVRGVLLFRVEPRGQLGWAIAPIAAPRWREGVTANHST